MLYQSTLHATFEHSKHAVLEHSNMSYPSTASMLYQSTPHAVPEHSSKCRIRAHHMPYQSTPNIFRLIRKIPKQSHRETTRLKLINGNGQFRLLIFGDSIAPHSHGSREKRQTLHQEQETILRALLGESFVLLFRNRLKRVSFSSDPSS